MNLIYSALGHPFFTFYALVATLLLAVLIFEYKKREKLFNKFNQGSKPLTGPFQLPLFGNIYQIAKPSRSNILKKYINLYETWCHLGAGRIWLGHRLFIFVFSPEYYEMILGDVKIVQKPAEYKLLQSSPLGEGLISQKDADLWRAHRKIITPTFHFNVLKTYLPVYHEETIILLNILEQKFTSSDSNVIVVPNLQPLIALSGFEMILRNAFGVRIHAQENENHSFVSAITEATHIIQDRLLMPWLLMDSLFSLFGYEKEQERVKKICHEFTESVIHTKRLEHKRKQELASKYAPLSHEGHSDSSNGTSDMNSNHVGANISNMDNSSSYANSIGNRVRESMTVTESCATHKSFLELIIENEANEEVKMSDEEIRDNMITIMFGGHDTTASTNCVTLLMLAIHPEIQDKTIEEIDAVFGGPDVDDGHSPTYGELMELHTLDKVIKEACRLYPAVPLFARAITKDTPMGPYVLPNGSSVVFFTFGLHRDPRFHERPNEFWPDRFLPQNSRTTHNYAYLPFSAGSRNCVGQKYAMLQMKTLLSTILRKYRVGTEDAIRRVQDVDDLLTVNMTLSLDRCPVVLTPRSGGHPP